MKVNKTTTTTTMTMLMLTMTMMMLMVMVMMLMMMMMMMVMMMVVVESIGGMAIKMVKSCIDVHKNRFYVHSISLGALDQVSGCDVFVTSSSLFFVQYLTFEDLFAACFCGG